MRSYLKRLFLNTGNPAKDSYLWNMIQSLLISVQSAILLMVINRTNSLSDAGVFSIAYAVASLMYYLGEYGVRKFQVTDVNEQASFSDYYTHRVITCGITALASIIYVTVGLVNGKNNAEKTFVILLVCIVKDLEAYCDVYFARFQQMGRLDAAAKASTYRIVLPLLFCIGSLILTHDLVLSMSVWLAATVFAIMTSFVLLSPEFGNAGISFKVSKLLMITRECLPLFLGNFLLLYVGNAPKYAIDACMSSEDQACYNFIFMPVFVIGLLANFVFNPILMELAREWNDGNYKRFYALVKRQTAVITGITLLAIIVALTIGCPVLGMMFHADLSDYRVHLTVLMVGGGLLAFVNFLAVIVTVLRGQKKLIIGYLVSALTAGLFSNAVVRAYGLWGACLLYTVLMVIVTLIFAVIFAICARSAKKPAQTT